METLEAYALRLARLYTIQYAGLVMIAYLLMHLWEYQL